MSPTGITVSVEYFAQLREQAGRSREEIRTGAGTAAGLYDELRTRHGFVLDRSALRVAINDDFAEWLRPLADGDRVVFIPPVAGG
jgi:molybdopterin converting factor subunit 1